MLKYADNVKYLGNIDSSDTKAVIAALYNRNHAMVNDSDLVFGVYHDNNWRDENARGGTAECLRYAAKHNKKILVLNPITLAYI